MSLESLKWACCGCSSSPSKVWEKKRKLMKLEFYSWSRNVLLSLEPWGRKDCFPFSLPPNKTGFLLHGGASTQAKDINGAVQQTQDTRMDTCMRQISHQASLPSSESRAVFRQSSWIGVTFLSPWELFPGGIFMTSMHTHRNSYCTHIFSLLLAFASTNLWKEQISNSPEVNCKHNLLKSF